MADGDDFLRGIPKFLRRPREPLPAAPKFMTPRPAAGPPPGDIPPALQAAAEAPARRPGALQPRRPAPVPAEPAGSAVVTLPPRQAAPPAPPPAPPSPQASSGDFFAEVRGDIASLFATAAPDDSDEEDDAAFQVILPRGVVRQIRLLAAQESTTQRAIVLKALRLAGLAVPEGADIDRRILAGRRRQQA